MWEWLLSHPVQPGAVFLAEMLMPLSANVIYWCAPAYVGLLYGLIYGVKLGFLGAALAGVPLTVGAACLGKALEISIMIRFPPRSVAESSASWIGWDTQYYCFPLSDFMLCRASFSLREESSRYRLVCRGRGCVYSLEADLARATTFSRTSLFAGR